MAESAGRKRKSRWGDGAAAAEAEMERMLAERNAALQKTIEEANRRAQAQRFPAPLILDEQGREVDEKGNVVTRRVADLATEEPVERVEQAPWYDPRVHASRATLRSRRSFSFVQPGKFIRKAQNLRLRQMRNDLRAAAENPAPMHDDFAAAGDPNAIALGSRFSHTEVFIEPGVPDVEWWDQAILADPNDPSSPVDPAKLSSLVEHPVPLKPRAEPPPPPVQPMVLTEKEKKKIRRMRKLEKQREVRDKIRLGLAAPPQPRITLKNMFRVMPHEAIEDPTAVEAKARAEMEKRQVEHHLQNESRRLTPQQRAEKKRKKLEEDTSREVVVAVFRVDRLDMPQNRFKMSVNAEELKLTGCMICFEGCNVVVVEGGPRGIRKYTRLMLHRIKWVPEQNHADDEDDDDEDQDDVKSSPGNHCCLVWRGVVVKRSFSGFRVHSCVSEEQARKIVADKHLGHYWDMARNFQADMGTVIV
ncbi:unnamed protein product (mitochondrion) [Plasmodiophora brassicae]|uniref:Uncharacterized protein n=1 Tax=Plasmodiophora brassicae TaxID=37360 RepID=A0A3P3Y367_PLABS|nr:unnamed protein product [Plasmodiophora brassicae]